MFANISFYASAANNMFSVSPSVVCPLATVLCDAIFLYIVERFQRNLPQIFITCLKAAENVFKLRGQRSGSNVYKCVSAIASKTYPSTV